MAKVIFNGDLIDEANAKISIADKGYWFDFAVYSSLKVVQGKISSPGFHVDRLIESAKLIGLEHPFKKPEILKWFEQLVKANQFKDVLLRVTLIGDPDDSSAAKLYIFKVSGLTFYPDKLYKIGVKVITYHGERALPRAKTKDLLLSFLALREAKQQGALEALLIDNQGNIREGTRTNFYALKNNLIITPPPTKVVAGIAQKKLLAALKGQFEVKYENIALSKLKSYDEFFISSTSMNVMPVSQIDRTIIKSDFTQTRLIQKLYKNYDLKS